MLTKPHKVVLFSLGKCYGMLDKTFSDKPFKVAVSKSDFIALLIKSKMAFKKERALYKNLEFLEKKKYISYRNKQIKFTKKGFSAFTKVKRELEPFLAHSDFWKKNGKKIRKLQAVLN